MFLIKDLKYKNILDIDKLEIKNNQVSSILGRSGSGKTTLLKMFNKLLSPDSGDVYYEGKNLKDIDSVLLRREVMMLGQTPVIFSGTIRDNLLIARRFSRKDDLEDSILKEVLLKLDLEKNLEQDAKDLSGGEKQRIALARIILCQPRVFLLDEPSSALDKETEESIIKNLVDYSRENKKTLIMVTHSREIGEKYSDAIVEIDEGKIKKGR